jgi:succinyl-diaminopimelate desuccinylase
VFITPTVFQSGSCDQLNVISGKGILGLDVRTIPGVDHAALAVGLAHDADEIAQRHGLQLHVDVIEDRPPAEVSEGSLLVTAVRLAHVASWKLDKASGCESRPGNRRRAR